MKRLAFSGHPVTRGSDLPAGPDAFKSSAPQAEPRRATMADFWLQNGWYKEMRDGSRKLTRADWSQGFGIRGEAVRFLVEKVLRKNPCDVVVKDFNSNRLSGLLSNCCDSSPYDALTKAGYRMLPWEMLQTPRGFFDSRKNRIAAVRWLVKKLKKDPRDMAKDDFRSNRLGGLLTDHCNGSPYDAFIEAGYKILPWEMLRTPNGFFDSRKNRIAAVRWLVKKLGKEPRNIIAGDFISNRLCGLLDRHDGSPYDALFEAKQVTAADEAYMRQEGGARFMEVPK